MTRQNQDEIDGDQADRLNEEARHSRRENLLARTRIQRERMKRDAEEMTCALGLPRETVYDVLAVLYGQR